MDTSTRFDFVEEEHDGCDGCDHHEEKDWYYLTERRPTIYLTEKSLLPRQRSHAMNCSRLIGNIRAQPENYDNFPYLRDLPGKLASKANDVDIVIHVLSNCPEMKEHLKELLKIYPHTSIEYLALLNYVDQF